MRSSRFFLLWVVLVAFLAFVSALPPYASAAQYKVLYDFRGGAEGAEPQGLVQDAAGNLYGTTALGGDSNCYGAWGRCGIVFKLDNVGKLTVLHKFTNHSDGAFPTTVVLSGNILYGAASMGGNLHCYYDYGCGVLFEINIQTHAFKVLHTFNWLDGNEPSSLTLRSGVLYGTASGGGSEDCGYFGCGVLFKLVLKTNAYTVLHVFNSSDGASPSSPLALDKAGSVLYGVTAAGGIAAPNSRCQLGCGVAFRLVVKTSAYTVLYTFTGPPDDAEYPFGPLALDSSGNLIGDSQLGGSYPCPCDCGCGTVFRVDPSTGTDVVLYNFAGGADGNYPQAGIIPSQDTIYGTTAWGGSNDDGTVFELVGNTETVLHTFSGSDGSGPAADVIMDSKGNLFGTAFNGGTHICYAGYGCGVVWKITR